MEKYETKRAIVKLVDTGRLPSNREAFRHIKIYKDEINTLPKPLDRNGKKFLEYQREIQKLRTRSRNLRRQRFIFDVYVKQYRQNVPIEWEFQHCELGPQYRKAFKEMIKKVVDNAIHQCRMYIDWDYKYQGGPRVVKWFGPFNTQFLGDKKTQGRVFFKEGEVLRVYVEKNLKNLYEDKKPVEPRKYIGIELEFCAPIKENQFAVKLFRAGIHKFAQLKKDGSLRPHEGEVGYELAILLEESNYKKRLKQLTNILTEVKAVAVDRRAGLHVHLDMRRRDKELVYNNLVACQYALLSIVDPRRLDNEFCRIVDSRKFPTEFTGEREERYKTINAAAFYKYHTLEVRMHEGSVDFTQISNWVDLLIRIGNYGKKIKDDVTKVTVLKKRVALDQKLYSYLQDRSCFWQLHNNGHNHVLRDRINRLAEIEQARQRVAAMQNNLGQDVAVAPPAPERLFTNPYLDRVAEVQATPAAGGGQMIYRTIGQLEELYGRAAATPAPAIADAATFGLTFTHADGTVVANNEVFYPPGNNMPDEPPEEMNPEPDDFDFDIGDDENEN